MLAGEIPKSSLSADESHKITLTAEEIPRPSTVSSEETSQISSESIGVLQPSSVDIHELVIRTNDEGQDILVQNEG